MTEFIPDKNIPDVILVKPKRFGDSRGFFEESYVRQRYVAGGIEVEFVQDNHSLSQNVGTIRGLHFQVPPHAQAKLVRCTRGRLIDVAVDIRKGSPTFGQHVAAELSAENGWQLFVPEGFAHGFVTLEENSELQYKVSDYYAPECDAGLAYNDPSFKIDWRVAAGSVHLSEKDMQLPTLSEYESPFEYHVK